MASSAKTTPALFLDRDGVVNVEKNYLHRIEDFEFVDGIFELCRRYRDKGYLIVIVTNQSGIARGFYSEADFKKLTAWMTAEFEKRGIEIAKVYYCPHHPEISGACRCRKPEPGMFLDAARELDIDLERSVLVGDSERDIVAAQRAGVKETYLLGASATASAATKIIPSLKGLL
jgi:D-glycero-D-manno-heptose 1,7-bisphosphate phosphatase